MPKKLDSIEFGVLSPEEIRAMSVLHVVTPDTYDEDGYPIEMGLMDPRMGVIDPGLRCRTCRLRARDCPGHFGHIELAAPVVHVGFAKYIYDILRSTCRSCSRLLLTDEEIEEFREKMRKLEEIGKSKYDVYKDVVREARKRKAPGKKCPHCGAEQLEIKFEKPHSFYEGTQKLTPRDVRDRLERVPDEDLELLGINPRAARPEWMVLTVLPVPPVTVRPSITLETGERSEDDLTHKLVDIIRINRRLAENLEAGAPQLIVEDLWELLQYHVTTYIDNEVPGIPPAKHRSGRILKTLAQRLRGKEGRFRGNLSGKRVNFSARTVISPDPNIGINEVGVPLMCALELTVPERVTPRNIERLREYVMNGPNIYPGANYVIRPDGRRIKITDKNKERLAEELDFGYIVERHLQDGDIVLFNRQPSLHRMSIMAHTVRILPGKTFRLNLCVCPPYNADFDGDEMNLHVVQLEEARAEAEMLMKVEKQILSPRFGGPIIGGIHDHITGAYVLSRKDRKLSKAEAMQILYAAGITELPEPAGRDEKGEPYWTGKQILSLLLPKDLSLRYRSKVCRKCEKCLEEDCPYDAFVVIKDGQIVKGVLDEKAFGAMAGEILDVITKEYGGEAARKFLEAITKMALFMIMKRGFTVGLDEVDLPKEAIEEIEEIIQKAEEDVKRIIEAYERGELEPLPGRTLEETLEMKIMQRLSRARDDSGRVAERYLGMDNHVVMMARSGARGNILNITQMAACVGQQSVRGERIHRGYYNRTLPHFKRGDLGARARGFVKSSYKRGLNPLEYFFHAMGGREGLVDTAVRTSQSGYMQRRLINALQDLRVEYDGTVRDARGTIVQFYYGEDGVDPSKSDWGKAVNIERMANRVVSE